MGTSSAFGGPSSSTPLVPSWLEPDNPVSPDELVNDSADKVDEGTEVPNGSDAKPTFDPADQLLSTPNRFAAARGNFSRFASSGGQDRASLGRAVTHYVSTSSGGARRAAMRMGSSRTAGGRLLGFLSDAATRGGREALRALDLEGLAGRPIEEVFLGLMDYICPDGGSVNEGIARDSFIETIVDLAENGIADLDMLTIDQMQTVFELYATHSIEARLWNDIGMKAIVLPSDLREAERVQDQLQDFIRRGVADALTTARATLQALTPNRVSGLVDWVYEQAFRILQILGESEAGAA